MLKNGSLRDGENLEPEIESHGAPKRAGNDPWRLIRPSNSRIDEPRDEDHRSEFRVVRPAVSPARHA